MRYVWDYAGEGCASFGSGSEAPAEDPAREGMDCIGDAYSSRAGRLTRDGWFAEGESKGRGCKVDRSTGIGGLSGHLVGRQTWIDRGLASWAPAEVESAQAERLGEAAKGEQMDVDPVNGIGVGWQYRPVSPVSVQGPHGEDESFSASDNPVSMQAFHTDRWQ